jgi:hypothetical protein
MGKMVLALVPCLFVMALGSAGATQPETLVFNGICDASAGVALDENRIIVGDDEQPWLPIYRLGGGDSDARIPLPRAPASTGDVEPEADLEGATIGSKAIRSRWQCKVPEMSPAWFWSINCAAWTGGPGAPRRRAERRQR